MITFRVMVRRSIGLTALAPMVGIVLLHILGRERPWTHEWFWAIYQFNFVTVMLGPVVAGFGAWEGSRFARGRSLFGTSDRELVGLASIWAALLAWVFVAYAVGLAVVATLVKLAGTPGLPDAFAAGTILPAFSLLAAEAAVGLAAGWVLKSPLTAPACAVGSFLLILFLYTKGPGQLIIVGGADDSLLHLAPRANLEAAQSLCYLVVSVAALVFAAHWTGRRHKYHPVTAPSAGFFAVLSIVLVIAQGGTILERHAPNLRCFGVRPEVCAGPGYAQKLRDARAAFLPYLHVLETAGVPVPYRFAQGQEPGNRSVGPLTFALLNGSKEEAGRLTMASYFRKSCALEGKNGHVYDLYRAASYWVSAQATGTTMPYDPAIPNVLQRGNVEEQRRWLRNAMSVIQQCGA